METKRQHYVPRFYLDSFATREEGARTATFWVYDKKTGGEPRRQTPVNTAVEGHFYDLEHEGRPVPVEQMLAHMESQAKPVLDRWGIGEIDRRDIPLLARFLSHLYTRVPRNIAAIEESGVMLAHEMLKASAEGSDDEIAATIQASGVEGVTVEQLRESYRTCETFFTPDVPEGYWLAASLRLAPVVERELLRLHWAVCTAPARSTFITSDTPLCTFAWMGRNVAIFGGGIAQPGARITLPLNPRTCLYLTPWLKPERLPMVPGWVREVNRRMARIAERYVIATFRTPDMDAIVEESRVTVYTPKMDRAVVAQVARDAANERRYRNPRG